MSVGWHILSYLHFCLVRVQRRRRNDHAALAADLCMRCMLLNDLAGVETPSVKMLRDSRFGHHQHPAYQSLPSWRMVYFSGHHAGPSSLLWAAVRDHEHVRSAMASLQLRHISRLSEADGGKRHWQLQVGNRGVCANGTQWAVPRHAKDNCALQHAIKAAGAVAAWLPLAGEWLLLCLCAACYC